MSDDLLNFGFQPETSAIIKVIGVGGGGGNAVNFMYRKGIADVDFIVCNTDAQALENSPVPNAIQLGETLTRGRGAGNMPELGQQAAIENINNLRVLLEPNTRMVFIAACMGGGTGTGAAPVVAQLCRELNILTIAVVTVPSPTEGRKRYNQALEGVDRIKEHVDSLLIINNDKIRQIYGNLPASQAFAKADEIISTAVKGVAEIITLHGSINIDFADVNTVMAGSGVFIMGTGFGEGEGRALNAAREALESPLLDNNNIFGTQDILLNITSGDDEITIEEIGLINDFLQNEAGSDANIIWGNGYDKTLGNKIAVTIIATGFVETQKNYEPISEKPEVAEEVVEKVDLKEEIEDNEYFEVKPKIERNDDTVEFEIEPQYKKEEKRSTKEKVQRSKEDNWFFRQFNNLFDEDDDESELK